MSDPYILDQLQDFDNYGNTATERLVLRKRAYDEIKQLRIQVERKRPAPQASPDLFRRAADALRDIDPFGDKFSQRDLELIEHGHPVREFACEHCGGSGFSGSSQPTSNINECPSCHRMFKDGETCSRGGCPMGGDF